MTSAETETLRFYEAEAATYAARPDRAIPQALDRFIAQLPRGAIVLELGCGAGADSAYMIGKGIAVRPSDGTPAMAREAERLLGRPVDILAFSDLDEYETVGGIWANACLLHVPRAELASVLARIHRALQPGGIFVASYKAGQGEGRDRFGRYYNYPSIEELRAFYETLDWAELVIRERPGGGGYDGQPTDWLSVTAIKPAAG